MTSPFPGMDPFLEDPRLWGDFHRELIGDLKREIADRLPERYLVRTNVRSYVELEESEEEVFLRPIVPEEFKEHFIDIFYQEEGETLVTSIEVLSPSNKRKGSTGWKEYLRKRQALLMGQANLVEIDLLRGGTRLPMLDPWPSCPYTILIARPISSLRCRVLKAYSLKPLPPLPVPLQQGEADVQVELQPLLDAAYRRYRYARSIDYSKPPSTLTSEELSWLQVRLSSRQQKA